METQLSKTQRQSNGLSRDVRRTVIFGFIATFAVAFAFGFYVASALASRFVLEAAK